MSDPGLSDVLLCLHPSDTVVLTKTNLAEGTVLTIEDRSIVLTSALGAGQKIARYKIAEGDLVLKYGAPIGLADTNIDVGEHVHLHNLVSQYTVIEDMEK